MNKKQLILSILILFLAISAFAQDYKPIVDEDKQKIDKFMDDLIDRDSTTTGISNAHSAAEEKWDIVLNKYYKLLMGILDKEGQKRLKEAQLAWIKYRDAEIENIYTNLLKASGGSSQINMASAEILGLTEDRALKLKEYYNLLTED